MIYPVLTKVSLVESLGLSVLGISIVFAALIALMVIVLIMSKVMAVKKDEKPAKDTTQQTVPASAVQTADASAGLQAHGSAGVIKLNNVSEKQAAMVMAIVADHLKVPLNQLRFKSIRRLD